VFNKNQSVSQSVNQSPTDGRCSIVVCKKQQSSLFVVHVVDEMFMKQNGQIMRLLCSWFNNDVMHVYPVQTTSNWFEQDIRV